VLDAFGKLDDMDIWGAVKLWQNNRDPILQMLCTMLLHRNLFQIVFTSEPIKKSQIEKVRTGVSKQFKLLRNDAAYLFSLGTVTNEAYLSEKQAIHVLTKNGDVVDIAQVSDLPSIRAMSKIVKKNYLCWPKNVYL